MQRRRMYMIISPRIRAKKKEKIDNKNEREKEKEGRKPIPIGGVSQQERAVQKRVNIVTNTNKVTNDEKWHRHQHSDKR